MVRQQDGQGRVHVFGGSSLSGELSEMTQRQRRRHTVLVVLLEVLRFMHKDLEVDALMHLISCGDELDELGYRLLIEILANASAWVSTRRYAYSDIDHEDDSGKVGERCP